MLCFPICKLRVPESLTEPPVGSPEVPLEGTRLQALSPWSANSQAGEGCGHQPRAAGAQETDNRILRTLKAKLSEKASAVFPSAKLSPKIKIKKANGLVSLFLLSGGFAHSAGDNSRLLRPGGRALHRPPGQSGNQATEGPRGTPRLWGHQATGKCVCVCGGGMQSR